MAHPMSETSATGSGTFGNDAIIDTLALEGSNIATGARTWIEEELRRRTGMKLGLGPMNPFAGMVSLWQE